MENTKKGTEKTILALTQSELYKTDGFFETSHTRKKPRGSRPKSYKGMTVLISDNKVIVDISVNITVTTEIMLSCADFQARLKKRIEALDLEVTDINIRINDTI